jgi:mono/diheme cytochrome c family protein
MNKSRSISNFVFSLVQFMVLLCTSKFLFATSPSVLPQLSPGNTFIQKDGEGLYRASCQGCHMSKGEGVSTGAGMYPPLANNLKLTSAAYPIYNVLHGRHGMPDFAQSMDDAQVAEVVNYVRTHMGNHYTDRVTPEDVKKLR